MIDILLADDHALFRKGMIAYFKTFGNINQVYEAENGKQVLELMSVHPIQIVLLDIRMPILDGFETAIALKQHFPNTKVLILTMYDEESLIMSMIKIGINGYILKNDDCISDAITAAINGHFYYSKSLKPVICKAQQLLHTHQRIQLTSSQMQIVNFLASGKNSSQIAQEMELSKNTIDAYRKDLLAKFGVSNCTQLVDVAHKMGIL